MRITNSSEYAIRAVLHMAKDPARYYTVTELHQPIEAPLKFLSKILQKLSGAKILKSSRGVKGGFSLNVPLNELNLCHVVEAVDGPLALNKCLLAGYECSREPRCPIHPIWEDAQTALKEILSRKSFADILREMHAIPGGSGNNAKSA